MTADGDEPGAPDDPAVPGATGESTFPGEAPAHRSAHELLDDARHVIADERDAHTPDAEVRSLGEQVTGDEPPMLIEAMGGPLGMAESAIPSAAFVIAITAGASIEKGAIIAVAIAFVLALARAVRRQTAQFAITGVIGVGVSAYIASRTGEARDFFLPGFIANIAYAAIAFGSVAIRRPFVGYAAQGFSEAYSGWRDDPVKFRRIRLVTLMWGGIFVLRLAIQVPLYLTDSLVALGTAKIVMSLPLFAVGVWLSWLLLRTPAKRTGDAEGEPASP